MSLPFRGRIAAVFASLICAAATGLAGGSSAGAQALGQPDLFRYCQAYHGPTYPVFNFSLNYWACRQMTAYQQIFHRIDMRQACRLSYGTTNYRYVGRTPVCVQ